MSDLGTLGGTTSKAWGINTGGTIVGWANTGSGAQDAFIDTSGTLIDLNTLLDASGSGWLLNSARGINDSGQIVGYGTIGGVTHAFLLDIVPEPSACAMLIGGSGLLVWSSAFGGFRFGRIVPPQFFASPVLQNLGSCAKIPRKRNAHEKELSIR